MYGNCLLHPKVGPTERMLPAAGGEGAKASVGTKTIQAGVALHRRDEFNITINLEELL